MTVKEAKSFGKTANDADLFLKYVELRRAAAAGEEFSPTSDAANRLAIELGRRGIKVPTDRSVLG